MSVTGAIETYTNFFFFLALFSLFQNRFFFFLTQILLLEITKNLNFYARTFYQCAILCPTPNMSEIFRMKSSPLASEINFILCTIRDLSVSLLKFFMEKSKQSPRENEQINIWTLRTHPVHKCTYMYIILYIIIL